MNCMSEADANLAQGAEDGDEFPPELPKPDLDLGRHNIDLLATLQEKTKGNLSADEQRSLDNSVIELRFRFVQASEQYTKDQHHAKKQAA
jgi:hypothetical protein